MPRPRFTLRVVLVVTAFVAVIAWQASMVSQRRAAMKSQHIFILDKHSPAATRPSINPLRVLLGDEPVRFIFLRFSDEEWQVERNRIKRLFPEADVAMGSVHPF